MIHLPAIYSQRDGRWGNQILGNNTDPVYSIFSYGCLISCLSMVACYYNRSETPTSINQHLKELNPSGFGPSSGNYVFGSITRIFPEIKEGQVWTPDLLTDNQMGEIKTAIDNGFPVMCELDFQPQSQALDMHFVLLVGYNPANENDFTMADPWTGTLHSLRDYLGWWKPNARNTIEGYFVMTGPVPVTIDFMNTTLPVADFEGGHHSAAWYMHEWQVEKTGRKDDINKLNILIQQLRSKVKGHLDAAVSELVKLGEELK